jgi:hypothetical protein
MRVLTIILNILLILIIILSVFDGEWQGEDVWYLPLFLSPPVASLYVILRSK